MKKRKYPVTAPSGRQYEVTVKRNYAVLGAYSLDFEVARFEERKSFRRMKSVRIIEESTRYWERAVIDVVETAKALVERVDERLDADARRNESFDAFDRWDGVI
ncbi:MULTISPECIES: hypothetical protein [Paenibacillus]|uniref:hypothetical protein n=1 Tax=Paenibacillus TaxID=44249 RepID=UPI00038F4FDE|nr:MULTISPECIES: hypothetical protein [Paenibacillus]CDN42013.1 hypothetical protein BN871_AT_00150 [Paenibacillus sp. P22]